MAAKSSVSRGLLFGAEFFSELYKEITKLGLTDEQMHEAIERKFKTTSNFAKVVAKLIVAEIEAGKKLALKHLKLIADSISLEAASFARDSFFCSGGPVKLYYGDNFRNWVLKAMPKEIPAWNGSLRKTQLSQLMDDSTILNELGNPQLLTIQEFSAIIKHLIQQQPNGEAGTLLNNGYANIFYVQLGLRVVAVGVFWHSGGREWSLSADGLGGRRWGDGRCVFSRR